MLSQQEISDRIEIRDLLVEYAARLDEGDLDGLREVFTEDAEIDYTETGAPAGGPEEIIAFLKRAMASFPRYQHVLGNTRVRLDGDEADAETQCFNPMVMNHHGEERVFFVGLWYVDRLLRTDRGWRIRKRREKLCYFHNFPEDFEIPQ